MSLLHLLRLKDKHMKNIKRLSIIFITSLVLSLALPVISLTMTEKKVRDIQALHDALLPGQRIILSHSSRCGFHPRWVQDTNITFKTNDEGDVSVYIPFSGSPSGFGCNQFDLESVSGIQVEDASTGEVIKSIYW